MREETLHGLELSQAGPDDAADLVSVMHAAFAARSPVDPPPAALSETADSVATAITAGSGVIARVDGRPVGGLVLAPVDADEVIVTRVSVHPDFQGRGLASGIVAAAHEIAGRSGFSRARLLVRSEFPALVRWWERRGYRQLEQTANGPVLAADLPVPITVSDAPGMKRLGRELADRVRPGDVIILTGDLGAGKTTMTQGMGEGLGVDDDVISPTFVLSRIHATPQGRPDLVHVDAYRLTSPDDLDDLDLEATADAAVTVIEWGRGLAEQLSADRLELSIFAEADGSRTVLISGVSERWPRHELLDLGRKVIEGQHV